MARVTLEQWRVLQTLAEEKSFAKAAQKLHKSQSSVSYAVMQLQEALGIKVLQMQGRKAIFTEQGLQVLNRSKQLTRLAKNIENSAHNLKSNYEQSLRLAVDEIFPPQLLMKILYQFSLHNTQTRLIIRQGLLSGPSEQLVNGEADLIVVSQIPEGYVGDKLLDIQSIPYAHINSPLHQKVLNLDDLYDERYIIAQDSGVKNKRNEGWLGSEFHWKVSSMEMKIQCVAHGIGFSWLPKQLVTGRNLPIRPLNLQQDNVRTYPLYLVHHNPQEIGPSAHQLMELFRELGLNYRNEGMP